MKHSESCRNRICFTHMSIAAPVLGYIHGERRETAVAWQREAAVTDTGLCLVRCVIHLWSSQLNTSAG